AVLSTLLQSSANRFKRPFCLVHDVAAIDHPAGAERGETNVKGKQLQQGKQKKQCAAEAEQNQHKRNQADQADIFEMTILKQAEVLREHKGTQYRQHESGESHD